jgi:hypothetical protein
MKRISPKRGYPAATTIDIDHPDSSPQLGGSVKNRLKTTAAAWSIVTAAIAPFNSAHAQSEAAALSAASALPLASVVMGASAVAGSVVALPVALSTAGAVLVVKTVESTAHGTMVVLERVSDGAQASVEVIGKGLAAASLATGAVVTVSVIGAGVILSIAGEAVAFVANSLGRALLHDERIAY